MYKMVLIVSNANGEQKQILRIILWMYFYVVIGAYVL